MIGLATMYGMPMGLPLRRQTLGALRPRPEGGAVIVKAAASRNVFRDYLSLSKPRIVLLLLFTALAGMFLASAGRQM